MSYEQEFMKEFEACAIRFDGCWMHDTIALDFL